MAYLSPLNYAKERLVSQMQDLINLAAIELKIYTLSGIIDDLSYLELVGTNYKA